ncbi:MAG: carboxypeptidase-like regulatory domain-containing protein [Chitinophagaceae bacterium]|nr:carboxypeptidase-like regulatory domain-containing protein [Chitinophagaceae bacterium]
MRRYLFIISLLTTILLLGTEKSAAQYKLRGYVYDSTRNFPLEAVSVISTSGKGAVTNADGFYEINVSEKDSVWFSYLGKPTVKFAVSKIPNPLEFDISLHVNVTVLKEVKVRPRNYKFDSILNRQNYAKVFNYKKPTLKPTLTGSGVGLDLDEIINMFRVKRNRSLEAFRQRLLKEEEEKFVDHRFNKALVRRLTKLDGQQLDSFMRSFRPSYYFAKLAGDYEFQYYIKEALYRFRKGLPPQPMIKDGEIDE